MVLAAVSPGLSRLPRALACVAAIGAVSGSAALAQDDGGATLGVELNKLEQVGSACRSYVVLRNRTGATLERLSLDLVVFDTDGVIDRRLAVELGPAAPGRTQVRAFDMSGLDCGRVARVLLNDVLACEPDPLGEAGGCDTALHVSGRGNVDFIR